MTCNRLSPFGLLVVFCVLFCLGTASRDGFGAPDKTAEWPQFRGPTGQGVSDAAGVPTEWGAGKNVAWKVTVPGRGWSSPVLAGGKVYLTTAAGDRGQVALYAVCLDAATGKVLWDTEVFRPDPNTARGHQKNSPASATPFVTADRLYVHFGPMGTAALDLSGKILWRQTGIKYASVHGNGGSPVLVNDTLIFSCDGSRDPFLAALDAKTGEVKWKTPRNAPARNQFSFSTPLPIEVDGATQVVCPASGFVGGYDPATGKEIWRVRYGQGYSVVPRPVVRPRPAVRQFRLRQPGRLRDQAAGRQGGRDRLERRLDRPQERPLHAVATGRRRRGLPRHRPRRGHLRRRPHRKGPLVRTAGRGFLRLPRLRRRPGLLPERSRDGVRRQGREEVRACWPRTTSANGRWRPTRWGTGRCSSAPKGTSGKSRPEGPGNDPANDPGPSSRLEPNRRRSSDGFRSDEDQRDNRNRPADGAAAGPMPPRGGTPAAHRCLEWV